MKTRYHSNNSGGAWWLSDAHWFALQDAGWNVEWIKDDPYYEGAERFLGALAIRASCEKSLEDAIAEWKDITGQDPDAKGCSCCGEPHYFEEFQ